jgi:hypothetical protein
MLFVTVPVDRWWARVAVTVVDTLLAVRRSKLRVHVHSTATIRRAVEREGARLVSREGRFAWQLLVFARP